MHVQLRKNFNTGSYSTGASKLKQACWYLIDVIFFKAKLMPFSNVLVGLLKIFGAKIGKEVRIKPGLQVKFPWKLEIGDYSWIADSVIENLDTVQIGKNCCISQGAMLLTGNHNYKKSTFDLITAPIILEDGVWIGARSIVCPGVYASTHAVLTVGSIATKNMDSYKVYQGNPAIPIKNRV